MATLTEAMPEVLVRLEAVEQFYDRRIRILGTPPGGALSRVISSH